MPFIGEMKLSHVAVAFLVCAVVYSAGTLLFSRYNEEAYDRLASHAVRLEQNVEDLRVLHARLVATAELYRRSRDAVALDARRLQYYEPGQAVIRPTDASSAGVSQSPGTVVRRPRPSGDKRPYIRAAAIVAFVLSLILQVLAEPSRSRTTQTMRRASR
jgi:hypothetical protein